MTALKKISLLKKEIEQLKPFMVRTSATIEPSRKYRFIITGQGNNVLKVGCCVTCGNCQFPNNLIMFKSYHYIML